MWLDLHMNNTTAVAPVVGTYVAQIINGQQHEAGLVTRVANGIAWIRPATFNGYPNYRKTFSLHQTFWGTLVTIEAPLETC